MSKQVEIPDPTRYAIYRDRGCLQKPDPLIALPKRFDFLNELATNVPKLLAAGSLRKELRKLPRISLSYLQGRKLDCAMRLFSYLASAFVYGEEEPVNVLPRNIAQALYYLAKHKYVDRKPILSYKSYCLDNWRRLDENGPIALGNIAIIQNFLGGIDEEWFILVHVEIEAEAAPIFFAIQEAQQAALENDPQKLLVHLETIAAAEKAMHDTLCRMGEHCDPYIYYTRVRPYIHKFEGVVYEGVSEYNNVPQNFFGETGAQSSISPALNAALGIKFTPDPLTVFEEGMFDYMPPLHRQFVRATEKADTSGASIRECVLRNRQIHPETVEAYNECIHWKLKFLREHFGDTQAYIRKQAQKSAANPTYTGTGGSPYMEYLQKHIEETEQHLIL